MIIVIKNCGFSCFGRYLWFFHCYNLSIEGWWGSDTLFFDDAKLTNWNYLSAQASANKITFLQWKNLSIQIFILWQTCKCLYFSLRCSYIPEKEIKIWVVTKKHLAQSTKPCLQFFKSLVIRPKPDDRINKKQMTELLLPLDQTIWPNLTTSPNKDKIKITHV